ncbi:MAG: cadherin domain-containing protein, partial [Crocosphaera sp.]
LSADSNGKSVAGETYLVFGTDQGFSANFDLSSLNGSNGFVINGLYNSGFLGRSVSGAGDVNGDGFDDLLIGASGVPLNNINAKESYVVFGSDQGFSASFDLSSLDGSNGFVLNGLKSDDGFGISVSGAGDINSDGFDDLLIGGSLADPNSIFEAGQSYVVFGRANFTPSLEIANLGTPNVDENSSNGTIITLLFTDDPHDTHTYSLIDDAGGRFAINQYNQLIVADGSSLDFETNTSHQIIVQTTDSGGKSLEQTFTINVNDIDDNVNNINGIGFDNDDDLLNDTNTLFQLDGTQTFGNQAYNDYQGLNDPEAIDGWKDDSISLGQYFTGEYDPPFVFNDNDTVNNLGGSSQFRNLVLSEVT